MSDPHTQQSAPGDAWTPRLVSAIVLIVWALVQWHLLTEVIHESMREFVSRMLGTLDAAVLAVLYYYLGSSDSSRSKNRLLAEKGERE